MPNARILYCSIMLLLGVPELFACGYDWVGECSSSIHLRINGSLDSFTIADCPSGIRYQGLHLGVLKSLSLVNAKAITWESCLNNVTGVALFYRLYEQGGGAGNFQSLSLDQDHFTIEGPYTTRYRSKPGNLDLAAGLSIGKTYVLEVYLQAAIDTLGDDFIPETVLLKNNGGQYYHLSFTYGGPAANPFVVIPTQVKKPKCHGESNGAIGVSVWGDQSGLFYNWSNVNLNFFQQSGLPAGAYTVTVSGTNHTESVTIVLDQPDLLQIQNTDIQPISCGGGLGSIAVQAVGGTAPYHYLWSNGATTAGVELAVSGNYSLSITDAFQCIHISTIHLPSTGTIQANSSLNICNGQAVMVGGTLIQSAGNYTINLPGNGACDTLLNLTVTETNPIAGFSGAFELNCDTTTKPLLLQAFTNASPAVYYWTYDGQTLSTADSCWFVITEYETIPPGIIVLVLPQLLVTDQFGCSVWATPNITVTQNHNVPEIELTGTDASGSSTADGAVTLEISGGGPFDILWSNGATSMQITNLLPGLYCVTVVGANACAITDCIEIQWSNNSKAPMDGSLKLFPNPAEPGDWVQMVIPETIAGKQLTVTLMDYQGKKIKTETMVKNAQNERFQLPERLLPGIYWIQLSTPKGQAIGKICLKK